MRSDVEIRKSAKEFSQRWKNKGYEKGESQTFWLSLLNEVYGVEYPSEFITFEDQVKDMMDHTAFLDGYISQTKVLIEQKSIKVDLNKGIRQSDGSLLSPFQQAKRYSANLPYSKRPRWIITSNFKEFYIYDMENPQGEPEIIQLADLEKEYYRMNFLINTEDTNIAKEKELSLTAGKLVGILYNALLKEYNNPEDPETLKDLNVLSVRLVFCLYAEDAGLFGKRSMFYDYLYPYRENPDGFRRALLDLFVVLDQEIDERDPYLSDALASFPYVNGGLFENEKIIIPRINEEIIDIILNRASLDFNWSDISPTIFGAVFESTLNPETRHAGGMHYTSIENIHKVIDPLFLDGLNEEFEKIRLNSQIRNKKSSLEKLQNKLASLTFLDPAAGSGNFLTESYLSLRRLENKILKEIISIDGTMGTSMQMSLGDNAYNPIKVSISQFYGIEINDFAATVAKTALWIAESQMIRETEDIVHSQIEFFPLKTYANIVEGNALEIDWNDVIHNSELDYIMGNPPFLGSRYMSNKQSNELKVVFNETTGIGKLDYVTGWYKKSAEFINNTEIECAFVSTNSITQGEQVSLFWKDIIKQNKIYINFAYQTFKWVSEASDMAAVHCVIIGFSKKERKEKYLYTSESQFKRVDNINAYLVNAPDIFIDAISFPICNVPILKTGTRVGAQQYVFNEKDMIEFTKREPLSRKYFHEYLGGHEFINNKKRFCLYLEDCPVSDLANMPLSRKIIQEVLEDRINSNHKLKDFPKRYVKLSIPENDYIFIPQVSSENRRYIPMGFVKKEIWTADPHFMLEKSNLYIFGILTSNVHMSWMRAVAGRLEMRYRYSNRIVYNTFPWPNPTEEQVNRIKTTAKEILQARKENEGSSLANLYDEVMMPSNLRMAHQQNDKAVMEAYGFNINMTESEAVAELMKMYKELTDK